MGAAAHEPTSPSGDDLAAVLDEAWRLIGRGVVDRRSPFHTPSLATIHRDGGPSVRTVVLRGASREAGTARFHTDRRSAKIAEIARDPRVGLHFYDPARKVQLRVEGRAAVHQDDAVAEEAWRASQPMSRICYRVHPAPGTPVGHPSQVATNPDLDDPIAGREHFAVAVVEIQSIEWLHLAASGHRRARFDRRGDSWSATWLVP